MIMFSRTELTTGSSFQNKGEAEMQDWERFGEEIRRTVQDAVDSQDYRRLNQTITDTINRAVNGAVNGAEQGMRSFGNAFDQATRNTYGKRAGRTAWKIWSDGRI